MTLTRELLEQLLAQFSQLTIGLVGDLFLDRYLEIDGTLAETSIETGLEAYQVVRVRNSPGALGTVINNLTALKVGRLVPVTVIGDDGHGDDVLRSLSSMPVETAHILRCPERLTPTYTKPMKFDESGQGQELNRLDVRSREPLNEQSLRAVQQHFTSVFSQCDGWIVLDQIPETNCGVIPAAMRQTIGELTTRYPEKRVLVDSRRHLKTFNCGSPKGNRAEILGAVECPFEADDATLFKAALTLGSAPRPQFLHVG